MPAGLKRYWASRRRKAKPGGHSMRRKGAKRGRRYGRRAYGAVRRGGSKFMSMFGLKKDGLHVSDAVIIGGVAATFLLPSTGTANSSALGIMLGKGSYSSLTWDKRAEQAMIAAARVGLNYNMVPGMTGGYPGMGGYAVAGGVGMKVAGKFVNPLMRGSAVKL